MLGGERGLGQPERAADLLRARHVLMAGHRQSRARNDRIRLPTHFRGPRRLVVNRIANVALPHTVVFDEAKAVVPRFRIKVPSEV